MNRPSLSREDIENRLREDLRSTLQQHGVADTVGLLEDLVDDAMFQLEHLAEQKGFTL